MSEPAEIKPGANVTITWEGNPRGAGVKSNRLNGARTAKIILPSSGARGVAPLPGQTWLCQVERIANPKSERRGAIIVVPVRQKIDCTFENVWVDPVHAELMSVVLQHREKNLFFEGVQGVGKSTVAHAVAAKLGWEFRKIQGSQIKKFTTMYGRMRQKRLSTGEMIWDWSDSPLVRFVREAKAKPELEFLFMVDEYTRIDEDARDAFLEVIEGRERALTLPKPETITLPNNIHWMAAGNVGDSFTVKDQDAANTDRWVVIEISHMPFDVELAHCMRLYPTCDREKLERALRVVDQLRKIVTSQMRLSNTVSTRQTENMSMFLAEGIDIEEALLTAVANQFRGRRSDPTSERGRVALKIKEALSGTNLTAR